MALDERRAQRSAGAGDGEGAVPEGISVVAPVVVEAIAGVGDDLQVARTASAGGAEAP